MPVRLAHFFSAFQSLGGVQSVLRHQLAHDPSRGFESELIVYLEAQRARFERVHFVGPTSVSCVFAARRRVQKIVRSLQPQVAVYHGFWGISNFSDIDSAPHRVLVIHGDGPCMKHLIEASQWLDGILCVSEPLEAQVRSALPTWDPRRIGLLPYPIQPAIATIAAHSSLADRPLVVGYAGRFSRRQKRVELLPELIEHLDRGGRPFRFEMLGDGEERAWLEERLGGDPRVRFHGMLTGERYWRVLQGWDAIVYVSDYEGLPISMLEALSLGVIPVFPQIGCGGDEYAARVDPRLLFPRGDLQAAASCIRWLSQSHDSDVVSLRQRCRTAVATHLGSGYIDTFSSFVHGIMSIPPIAVTNFPRRQLLRDLCPEGIFERYQSISCRLKQRPC